MEVLALIFTACLVGAGIICIFAVKRGYQAATLQQEKQLEAERQAVVAERKMAQRRRKVWLAMDGLYAAFQEKVRSQEKLFVEKKQAELADPFQSISLSQIDAAFEQFTEDKSQKTL